MPYARRSFAGAAPATTLSSGITNADTTIPIVSAAGWPTGASGDFFIVVDRGSPSEEKVRCASRSGTTITVQTAGRGADGTSAATHAAGVAIEHTIVAVDADEANYAASQTVGQIAAAGDLLYGSAANTFAKLPKGTSGQYLKQGASVPAWGSLSLTSADIPDLAETIQDNIGAALTAGTNITVTYNDGAGTITIAQTNATSGGVTDFTEAVQDVVGALGLGGSGLTFTYNDGANTAVLDVNVDNATLEVSSDILRVKDAGIVAAKLANDSVVTAKILDANVTAAKLASEAATSFTPTVSGTGWALGNGTATGRYIKHGRLIHVDMLITWGSTSTYGVDPNPLQVGGLPVAVGNGIPISARVILQDDSAPLGYYGDWSVAAGATAGVVYGQTTFAAPGPVFRRGLNATFPFAWAVNDYVEIHLDYIGVS